MQNTTKERTLLPQLRLSLLHRCNDHVTNTSIRETVQACTKAIRLDDVERLGAAVVRAVEDRAGGETEGQAEFVAGGACACLSQNADYRYEILEKGDCVRQVIDRKRS